LRVRPAICQGILGLVQRGRAARDGKVAILLLAFLLGGVDRSSAGTNPPPGPFALQVMPANFSLVPGHNLQFSATRVFFRAGASQPAATEDISSRVQWNSSDMNIAMVNSSGLVTAGTNQGPVTITASKGPLSASVQLTVSSTVMLNSITITPAKPHVFLNAGTVTFTATGNYSDNTTQDLTGTATWSSSAAAVATMMNNAATFVNPGSTLISATTLGVTGSTGLQVIVLSSITVTPPTLAVVVNSGPVTFTATGIFSDGSTQNLTGSATWASSASAVATMTNNVATLAGTGSTNVSASSAITGQNVAGATTLQVVPVLTVSPSSPPTLSVLQNQQFTPNLPVSWSVDSAGAGNSTSGFISSGGVYTPTITSVGIHQITATTLSPPAQTKTVSIQVNAPYSGMLTYHNDNGRSGLNPHEAILTPANVNMAHFRNLFTIPVDGKVDAQPLYVPAMNIPNQGIHNVLFVATEHGSVYAFDADIGTQYWHVMMLKAGESSSDDRGCSQVTPEIGVTATPAIDLSQGANGVIYVVAMSKDGSGNYFQRLHALDLTTGAELFNGPVDIHATFPGSGDNSHSGNVVFDPAQYKERPGLLLLNGKIYTAWSSHCDGGLYTAWIMAYDETTLAQTNVINLTPNGSQGAFWNAGDGLAADNSGNIYQMLGNGTFDPALNASGFPNQGNYGNAFVKLSTAGNTLSVTDYFTMSDTVNESNADTDLGSGGAMLLPDMTDSQNNTRHLAIGAGKDGHIYLADRDNMGKFNTGSPNTNSNPNLYQDLPGGASGGIRSTPAYFNGYVYFGPTNGSIRAFQFSNARLNTVPTSHSAQSYGYPGATPSISANGTSNGIVWATENSTPAVLHAYDATSLGTELYNSNQAPGGRDSNFGNGNKFITPTIANGKVYVGTQNSVGVFGLF